MFQESVEIFFETCIFYNDGAVPNPKKQIPQASCVYFLLSHPLYMSMARPE